MTNIEQIVAVPTMEGSAEAVARAIDFLRYGTAIEERGDALFWARRVVTLEDQEYVDLHGLHDHGGLSGSTLTSPELADGGWWRVGVARDERPAPLAPLEESEVSRDVYINPETGEVGFSSFATRGATPPECVVSTPDVQMEVLRGMSGYEVVMRIGADAASDAAWL